MLGPWCQLASLSRGSGCLPSPYESQEICHQYNRTRGSARWLSLVEVVNSSWLCHQHLGCQGHWCQPCSWAFCGEQHLHLNDGDSSLRSQLSCWGRGSLIPSPVGQGPYQVAAAPPHMHSSHSGLGSRKRKTSRIPIMAPPHTVAAQLQAGATPVSLQFLFVPWQGGQLKSEVWVRMVPVIAFSPAPSRRFARWLAIRSGHLGISL